QQQRERRSSPIHDEVPEAVRHREVVVTVNFHISEGERLTISIAETQCASVTNFCPIGWVVHLDLGLSVLPLPELRDPVGLRLVYRDRSSLDRPSALGVDGDLGIRVLD